MKVKLILTIAAFFNYGITIYIQVMVGRILGASGQLDAYAIAGSIPQYVLSVISPAVAQVALATIIGLRVKEGEDKVRAFYTMLFMVELVLSALMIGVAVLWSGPLMETFFGTAKSSTLEMTAWLFPLLFLHSNVALMNDLQFTLFNSEKRFYRPAIARILINLTLLVAVPLLVIEYGIIGAVIARVCTTIALFVVLFRPLYLDRRTISLLKGEMRMFLILVGGTALQGALMKVYMVIERHFAVGLSTGDAYKVLLASTASISLMSIATGSYKLVNSVKLSELAAKDDKPGIRSAVRTDFRSMYVVLILLSCFLAIFSYPALRIFFAGSKLTLADCSEVSLTFYSFLPSFIFWGITNCILWPVMVAYRRQWSVILVNVPGGAIHYGLCWLIVPLLGLTGIGSSTSLFSLYITVSLLFLTNRFVGLGVSLPGFFRVMGFCMPGLFGVALTGAFLSWAHHTGLGPSIPMAIAASLVIFVAVLGTGKLLGLNEYPEVVAVFYRKLMEKLGRKK